MEKKKLLILGSDFGTLDTVHEAHEMGLYVIVSDTMESSPTKKAADEAWYISTTDIDALEKKCREENIAAVITGASDFNINCSRKLCKRLGLPYYAESDVAWETACNKSMFKKFCKQVGAPIATDYYLDEELSDECLDKIVFPVVVKPVDKSGNKGMSYCNNKEELRSAYAYARSASDNPTIIVERQLHGQEFAVNYVLADGHINLLYLSIEHHQPGQKANLYSLINTTSHNLKLYLEELNEKVKDVFKAAGLKDGIAWVECMLDSDGHFYLIEMGYRYGGEMTYATYKYVDGFNAIKWMIEIALGVKHTKEELPRPLTDAFPSTAASYHLFTTHEGVIGDIQGLEEIAKIPNIVIDMPKRIGNAVRDHACMGVIRLWGKDAEDLNSQIKIINDNLIVTDTEGNNLFIYFDNYNEIADDFNAGIKEFNA